MHAANALKHLPPRTRSIARIAGTLAAILSSISLAPQAYTVIRSRNISGLSLATYSIIVAASICWVVYNTLIGAFHAVVSSSFNLVISSVIASLILSIRYLGKDGIDITTEEMLKINEKLNKI